MRICKLDGCENAHNAGGYCAMHYARLRRAGSHPLGDRPRGDIETRFWNNTRRLGPDDCWIYGKGNGVRYRHLSRGGRGSGNITAHRFSYELHHGHIPEGMVVMHSCDNPRCVNPAHLSLGAYKDNAQDMIAKGRHARQAPLGEESGKSKLTDEKVRFIRAHPEIGHADLARLWGVSPNAIRGVRIGRTWRHVE